MLVFALIGPKESEQLLAAIRDTGEFWVPRPGQVPQVPAEIADTAGQVSPETIMRPAVMPSVNDKTAVMNRSDGSAKTLPASPKALNESKPKAL